MLFDVGDMPPSEPAPSDRVKAETDKFGGPG